MIEKKKYIIKRSLRKFEKNNVEAYIYIYNFIVLCDFCKTKKIMVIH